MNPTPSILTDEEIARVDAVIAEAEQRTNGEIIAVLAGRSGIYWHAPYEAGLWGAGLALLIGTLVWLLAGWGWPHWHVGWFSAIAGAGFLAGFVTARLAPVERFFAGEVVMRTECEERAWRVFGEHAVFGTQGRTGVLIYVSLFEHMVVVLGDAAISAKLGPVEYQAVVSSVVSRIKSGTLEQGLTDGIRMLGSRLAEEFPATPDDINELPDRLYVIP